MNWESELARMPQIFIQCLANSHVFYVILVDSEGNFLDCNDAFIRLMDLQEKPIGKNLKEFLSPHQNSFESIFAPCITMPSTLFLSFATKNKIRYSIVLHTTKIETGYLLLGEKVVLEDQEILRELSRLNNEQTNISHELHRKNIALERALSEINILQGLLSICSSCKRIQDNNGNWTQLEQYIMERSKAEFSHGLCDACFEKLYPEIYAKVKKNRNKT